MRTKKVAVGRPAVAYGFEEWLPTTAKGLARVQVWSDEAFHEGFVFDLPCWTHHGFEFNDLEGMPKSLRYTLRDGVEMVCSPPVRFYDRWVARTVYDLISTFRHNNVVELGAGNGPISRMLARDYVSNGECVLMPSDLLPDTPSFRALETEWPEKVAPIYDSCNMKNPPEFPSDSLLLLSGTFHHIPPSERLQVLRGLTSKADQVFITEPMRNTPFAIFVMFFAVFLLMLLPLRYLHRPGRLRRIFWCWLVPVAPLMLTWDAVVSCLRIWSDREWHDAISKLPGDIEMKIMKGPLLHSVLLTKRQETYRVPSGRVSNG